MPGFQFELSQLVNVPGKDQQGRISGRMESLTTSTIYEVKWLTEDCINTRTEMFGEAELIEAQKRKPDSTLTMKVEVDDTGMKKATDAANELRAAADAAAASLDRLPPNVLDLALDKRRATRARRTASKRKSKR